MHGIALSPLNSQASSLERKPCNICQVQPEPQREDGAHEADGPRAGDVPQPGMRKIVWGPGFRGS